MKQFIYLIILVILLFASAVIGYEAAQSWNNPILANICFCAFSIFWGSLLCIALADTEQKPNKQ